MFPAPVAVSTTVSPAAGLLLPSRATTVMVLASLPAMSAVGVAEMLERVGDTAPVVTCISTTSCTGMPLTVADTVLTSASVEPRRPVATPFSSVVSAG